MSPQVIHYLRVSQVFSRLISAILDILIEAVAMAVLVFVLVVAFATCLSVSIGQNDPLFAGFDASGAAALRVTLSLLSLYHRAMLPARPSARRSMTNLAACRFAAASVIDAYFVRQLKLWCACC